MPLGGGEHLPALAGWYAASVGNNYATPSFLHLLGGRPLPLNVLEQATMSLLGALSCSRLRVPLPGLAELRAAGPATVLGMGVCNAATCFLFMLSLSLLPAADRACAPRRQDPLSCRRLVRFTW